MSGVLDGSRELDRRSSISNQDILDFTNSNWHQLLILGNGFDLECGLHSSFSDFELIRKIKINLLDAMYYNNVEEWIDNLIDSGITLWDIILVQTKNSLWSDIESSIKDCVLDVSKYSVSNLTDFMISNIGKKQIRSNYNFIQKWTAVIPDFRAKVRTGYARQFLSTIDELILFYFVKLLDNMSIAVVDNRVISRVMLDQLHIIEKEFAKYLKQQINYAYYCDSCRLIKEIWWYGQPSKSEYKVNSSLINFNYTDPLNGIDDKYSMFNDGVINIHGSLEDDQIIFGIDGMGCMSDENVMPFTKTYRLMIWNRVIKTNLFYGPVKGDKQMVTKVIKFYGHSLSPADYSYFQSIFDDVDLYAGDTELIFFYRAHGNSNGEHGDGGGQQCDSREARNDMVQKVVRLINSYGSTLDNVDHGENMLHKLLLEGRLKVVELPKYM